MSVSSRFVCGACRYATRRVAATVASPNGFSSRAFGPASGASRAAFSTSTSRRKEKDDPTNTDPEFAFLDTKNPVEPEKLAKEPTATTSDGVTASIISDPTPTDPESTSSAANAAAAVPWYLRHTQDEASHSSQVIQKAHIPDLPTNPPPILPALLEYLAITAGLDDLSLLDLRSLDPPPALGPKLIMLIATARSERHLHVSADRFARWLRREHGLKANAAGLLGRNELKIKLRRKAKRMRMLANVGGALPDGNIDDGIRTGWICCTLSRVEAHPDDTHMPGDDVKEFIGFRDVKPGVNIVVQMFTEEKRAETDLETLWGGVLRTKKREERNADEVLRGLEQDLEDLESEEREEKERNARDAGEGAVATEEKPAAPLHQFRRPKASAGDVFPGADEVPSAKQMRGQMRRLHTVGLGR